MADPPRPTQGVVRSTRTGDSVRDAIVVANGDADPTRLRDLVAARPGRSSWRRMAARAPCWRPASGPTSSSATAIRCRRLTAHRLGERPASSCASCPPRRTRATPSSACSPRSRPARRASRSVARSAATGPSTRSRTSCCWPTRASTAARSSLHAGASRIERIGGDGGARVLRHPGVPGRLRLAVRGRRPRRWRPHERAALPAAAETLTVGPARGLSNELVGTDGRVATPTRPPPRRHHAAGRPEPPHAGRDGPRMNRRISPSRAALVVALGLACRRVRAWRSRDPRRRGAHAAPAHPRFVLPAADDDRRGLRGRARRAARGHLRRGRGRDRQPGDPDPIAGDEPLADVLYGVDNTFLSRALEAGVFEPYRSTEAGSVPAELRSLEGDLATPIDFGDVCLNIDVAAFAERGAARARRRSRTSLDPALRDTLVVEDPSRLVAGPRVPARDGRDLRRGSATSGWQAFWRALRANGVEVASGWEEAYYGRFSGGSGEGDRPDRRVVRVEPGRGGRLRATPTPSRTHAGARGGLLPPGRVRGRARRRREPELAEALHRLPAVARRRRRSCRWRCSCCPCARTSRCRRRSSGTRSGRRARDAGPGATSTPAVSAGSTSGPTSCCGEPPGQPAAGDPAARVPRALLRLAAAAASSRSAWPPRRARRWRRRDASGPSRRPRRLVFTLGSRDRLDRPDAWSWGCPRPGSSPASTSPAAGCSGRYGRAVRAADRRRRRRVPGAARPAQPAQRPGHAAVRRRGPAGPPRRLGRRPSSSRTSSTTSPSSCALVGGMWERARPACRGGGADARRLAAARAFREVTWPLLRPAVLSAASIVLLFTATSFGVVLLLGGPRDTTLEVEIYRQAAILPRPADGRRADAHPAGRRRLVLLVSARAAGARCDRAAAAARRPARWRGRRGPRTGAGRRRHDPRACCVAFLVAAARSCSSSARSPGPAGYGLERLAGAPRRGLAHAPPGRAESRPSSIRSSFAVSRRSSPRPLGLCAALVVGYRRGWLSRALDALVMLPLGHLGGHRGLRVPRRARPRRRSTCARRSCSSRIAHALIALPFVLRAVAPVDRARSTPGCARPPRSWAPRRRAPGARSMRRSWRAARWSARASRSPSRSASSARRSSSPARRRTTMPVAIYRLLGQPGAANFAMAMALATVLMVLTAVVDAAHRAGARPRRERASDGRT